MAKTQHMGDIGVCRRRIQDLEQRVMELEAEKRFWGFVHSNLTGEEENEEEMP